MRLYLSAIGLGFTLLFGSAYASESQDQEDFNQIKVGAEVKIESLQPKSKTFLIEIVDEPAVGPNYAKIRDFVDSVEFEGGYEGLRKKISKLKGSTYTLKKPLKLLSDEEMVKLGLQ